jgi:hypothetical protein
MPFDDNQKLTFEVGLWLVRLGVDALARTELMAASFTTDCCAGEQATASKRPSDSWLPNHSCLPKRKQRYKSSSDPGRAAVHSPGGFRVDVSASALAGTEPMAASFTTDCCAGEAVGPARASHRLQKTF